MSNASTLTLTYLEQAPAAAAKVLQEIGINDAAAFLETVPARLAAPVVNYMIPAAGARCLERLSTARAASVLRGLAYHDASSLLRLVRVERRDSILEELPSSVAKRLHRSLQYALNAVGAWIDPDVPLLSPEHSVEDALRYLRETRPASHIFLESTTNGRFLGAVGVRDLLRSQRAAPLGELALDAIAPVSNRAALATIAFHPAWDDYLMLPVVGRRYNLLGGLSRHALRRGLEEHQADAGAQAHSVIGNIGAALVLTSSALAQLVVQPRGPAHGR